MEPSPGTSGNFGSGALAQTSEPACFSTEMPGELDRHGDHPQSAFGIAMPPRGACFNGSLAPKLWHSEGCPSLRAGAVHAGALQTELELTMGNSEPMPTARQSSRAMRLPTQQAEASRRSVSPLAHRAHVCLRGGLRGVCPGRPCRVGGILGYALQASDEVTVLDTCGGGQGVRMALLRSVTRQSLPWRRGHVFGLSV